MPDLKLYRDRAGRGQAAGRTGGPAALSAPGRRDRALTRAPRHAAALVAPTALWRDHRLFTILTLLSLLPRILATRAFRPALLTADSFLYMNEAAHFTLGVIRPPGYSFFLLAVEPFRSLLLVTILQHLMGVAVAVIVYGLLRYHGLPGPGDPGQGAAGAAVVGVAAAERATPADYRWAPDAWWKHAERPPRTFNAYNDQLRLCSSRLGHAISAQPLAYLRVSARDAALALLSADRPPGNGPRGSMARAAGLICPAWPSMLPPRPGTATSLTCIPPRARSPIWTGGGAKRCMPARSALSSGSTPRAR